MLKPRARTVTYADIEALPPNMVGEIVYGVLHAQARPAPRHGIASDELRVELGNPFGRGRGGPGGWLFIAEPVYEGELNELIRCFNDEGTVRAAAQQALDRAIAGGRWRQEAQQRFDMPVRFRDFADFEQRMMRPTFADHRIDDAMLQRVAALYAPHQRADGARFTRPMHVRLLRRAG